jgi:hypothetical protein
MRGTFVLLGALLLASTFAAVVQAATFAVSVLPATVTSSAITLNGIDQKTSFSAAITVTAGSSVTGWNLTAWAPLPTSGANTLGALVVTTQPTLGACSPSGSCSLPVPAGITWPVTLGTTAGAAAKIYNAGVGSGNKDNIVNVTFDVNVPASALPGSYTTTLTIIGSSTGP